MTKENWATEQVRRIAATVRQLRGDRSGQWLSDETAKAGHRIARTTISELESGKRKTVTTAELCVLAWALKVPPVRLLYPDLPDGPVEIVPGVTVPSIKAATWFSGEAPNPERRKARLSRESARAIQEWARRSPDRLLDLARERDRLEHRIERLADASARLKSEDPSGSKELVNDIVETEERISDVTEEIRAIDGAFVTGEGAASDGG